MSENQFRRLWDAAELLQAADAAQILAEHVTRPNERGTSVTEDVPGAREQFRALSVDILEGVQVTSEQLDLLTNIGTRLTRESIVEVLTELLKVTYDARVDSKKVGGGMV